MSCSQKDQTKYKRSDFSSGRHRVAINSSWTSDQNESEIFDNLDESLPLLNHAGGPGVLPPTPPLGSFTTTVEYEAQVAREVRKYRLKYIFCQSCPKFCHNCRSRFPSEKSVYLVLFLCLFERLAYYAAVGNILQPFLDAKHINIPPVIQSLLLSTCLDMLAQLLFPIFGWIADAQVGRYNMLHFSMWLLWFSYGLMTLLHIILYSTMTRLEDTIIMKCYSYLLPVWMIIINIGSAGFQATAIPFGADQILYGPSGQISSFFYWYYWLRNLSAVFLYQILTCTIFNGMIFGLIATASMSVALILNATLNGWFFVDRERRNPLWNIIRIFLATIKAKRPQIRSAFSFSNLAAPTRMDLTKEVHGGQFDSEEVENAKTVGRILMVLLSVSGALIVYRGMRNVTGVQVQGTQQGRLFNFSTEFLKHCHLETNSTHVLLNVAAILITILILNQCLVPFLREYRPNMLQKIMIGYLFVILSCVSMLTIVGVGESMLHLSDRHNTCIFTANLSDSASNCIKLPVNPWTIMVPCILTSVAEVFINISCLEFCYAQSPHNMRGLMIGFFFFIRGFSDTIATAILTILSFSLKKVGPPGSCNFWYYLVFLAIGLITFIIFFLVARWYRNRKRPIDKENYVYYNLMM